MSTEDEKPETTEEEPVKPKRRRTKKAEAEATGPRGHRGRTRGRGARGCRRRAKADEPKADKPKAKKGAEVTAGRRSRTRRPKTEELVTVQARAKYVRTAPRKARLVVDHIRGKSAEEARAILTHTPRAAAEDVLKLLNSAIANAEANHELLPDELRVQAVFVDEGPTIKRYRPRAQGRATRIRKRTSHMTVVLTNEGSE